MDREILYRICKVSPQKDFVSPFLLLVLMILRIVRFREIKTENCCYAFDFSQTICHANYMMVMEKNFSLIQTISILIGLAVLASFLVIINLLAPVSFVENWKEVEIPEGSSYTGGMKILQDNGIIENRLTLLLLSKITNTEGQLKPGFYQLSSSMSPLEIFDVLIEGRIVRVSITIPEGSTLKTLKKRLEKARLMDEISWQLVYDRDFLASLDIKAPSLEGYIYPDTYLFSKGIDSKVVLKLMVRRMREVFDGPLRARAEELGMTENEVLALASIIEKEAVHDFERPIISGVYHNRLKKKMRLQADPTVLYGVTRRWKRIRYKDLRRANPYNTYKIKGLPPGPIASPGIKSIKAALYPSDVDYLFFVAMNNGKHYFSVTWEEHSKAVDYYQLNGYNKPANGEEKVN